MIHIQRKLQTIIVSFLTTLIFAGIAPIRINAMDRDNREFIKKEASSLQPRPSQTAQPRLQKALAPSAQPAQSSLYECYTCHRLYQRRWNFDRHTCPERTPAQSSSDEDEENSLNAELQFPSHIAKIMYWSDKILKAQIKKKANEIQEKEEEAKRKKLNRKRRLDATDSENDSEDCNNTARRRNPMRRAREQKRRILYINIVGLSDSQTEDE